MQHDNADKKDLAFFLCTVPREQLPVNEYRDLKESKFFRWAILERSKYTTKLLAVWISGFMLATFVVAAKSVRHEITLSSFVGSTIVAKITVLLCLMQLYTAWHYVHSRLINQKIAYAIPRARETTVWHKPKSMLMRDRLIARFQVRPILKPIEQTILLLLLFLSLNFLILFLIIKF